MYSVAPASPTADRASEPSANASSMGKSSTAAHNSLKSIQRLDAAMDWTQRRPSNQRKDSKSWICCQIRSLAQARFVSKWWRNAFSTRWAITRCPTWWRQRQTFCKSISLFITRECGGSGNYKYSIILSFQFWHATNVLCGLFHIYFYPHFLSPIHSRILNVKYVQNDPQAKELSISQRNCRFPYENYVEVHPYFSYSACSVQCRLDEQRRLCNCSSHIMPNTDVSWV